MLTHQPRVQSPFRSTPPLHPTPSLESTAFPATCKLRMRTVLSVRPPVASAAPSLTYATPCISLVQDPPHHTTFPLIRSSPIEESRALLPDACAPQARKQQHNRITRKGVGIGGVIAVWQVCAGAEGRSSPRQRLTARAPRWKRSLNTSSQPTPTLQGEPAAEHHTKPREGAEDSLRHGNAPAGDTPSQPHPGYPK